MGDPLVSAYKGTFHFQLSTAQLLLRYKSQFTGDYSAWRWASRVARVAENTSSMGSTPLCL